MGVNAMYEKDGIVYAGNSPVVKKVIFAEYQINHIIRVAFNTGEVVDVDFSHGFAGNAFEPLRDKKTLRQFEIMNGILTWMDGDIDVAPEYLLDVGKVIEPAMVL